MASLFTGAVNGPINNQENQGPIKGSNHTARQPSTSNPRLPLSNLSAKRTDPDENGQTPYQRQSYRKEDVAPSRSRFENGLEPESQRHLDLRKGSDGNLSNTGSDDIPDNMYRPEKEDIEGWIHREKLAKIENEELQAAGINLAKARTRSREALGNSLRTVSRDRLRSDFVTFEGGDRDEKRRKVSSPVPMQTHDDEGGERSQWDLRTPGEIAAEQSTSPMYTTPVSRKSGSKIPVLSLSASSTPYEKSDRETPEPIKRTMSCSASNEDGLHSPKLRTDSSKWNGEVDSVAPVGLSKTSSPTKKRQQSASSTPGSTNAKSTVPRKSSTASRAAAASPISGRPRTRGNDTDRPRTAVHPPEGDPPWLADMYKPDPRLPPDQQLIPTLAKKQMQQQWAENGMIPKTYDRDFEAIAVHQLNDNSRLQQSEFKEVSQKADDLEPWPLKSTTPVSSIKGTGSRPGTTSTPAPTGGYSTMPKVSSPPMSMTSPKIGSSIGANTGIASPNLTQNKQMNSTQQTTQRIQQRPQLDMDDEKAQNKGCCGCCVIM